MHGFQSLMTGEKKKNQQDKGREGVENFQIIAACEGA